LIDLPGLTKVAVGMLLFYLFKRKRTFSFGNSVSLTSGNLFIC